MQGLQGVKQRLSTLREKVAGQRTFLLIFGPLKSGKSTLMNALSGAYVSEVSSLPAYPALVYVKHGEAQRFQATDYDGRVREFSDNVSLADALRADHEQLADAIAGAEDRGEDFDPTTHYPEAIRRMDIDVPAVHLAESGSVLVDTPGLYTRMRFGYDEMTRDFRDTASCAIFVVKTDNLFFEKVFEEFEELLSCFSRVFLVSNIDSSKRDLCPDGSLEASLESRDPSKIIDAFRSLSMGATLRDAIDDGRLKIYPIDLLKAASRVLGGGDEPAAGADAAALAPGDRRDDGFDAFVADLTGYLDSSAYLQDFMRDSLRRAQELTAETSGLLAGTGAAELALTTRQAREELERGRARLAALETLVQEPWEEAFQPLREAKEALIAEWREQSAEALDAAGQEELSAWMASDESWQALFETRLNPQLEREGGAQARQLLEQLRARVDDAHAGASFSEPQLTALAEAGLQPDAVLAPCKQAFGATVQAGTFRVGVAADDVPVTRTLGDLLLFRSRNRVRQELFGEDGSGTIDPDVKERRLGGAGVRTLREKLRETVRQEMPELLSAYADELVDEHVKAAVEALRSEVEQLDARLRDSIAATETTLELRQQAQGVLETLQSGTVRFEGELGQLQRHLVVHSDNGEAVAVDRD